jgi:hypothetical protein
LDSIWTQLGQLFERSAQIFHVQAAVDPGRRAHVAVPQQALHAMSVDASAQGSVAVVCRRSWKRIGRGIAFGQSARPRG